MGVKQFSFYSQTKIAEITRYPKAFRAVTSKNQFIFFLKKILKSISLIVLMFSMFKSNSNFRCLSNQAHEQVVFHNLLISFVWLFL